MLDLRKTFDDIIRKWGVDVILQRRILTTGTDLYATQGDDVSSLFTNVLERYTCRYTYAGRKMSLASIEEERNEGIVHTVNLIFYMPWYSRPNEGDRIYLSDERYPNEETTYLLDYAEATRGFGGQVAYYTAGATRENPN